MIKALALMSRGIMAGILTFIIIQTTVNVLGIIPKFPSIMAITIGFIVTMQWPTIEQYWK